MRQSHVRRAEVALPAGTTSRPASRPAWRRAPTRSSGSGTAAVRVSRDLADRVHDVRHPALPAPLTSTVLFATATPRARSGCSSRSTSPCAAQARRRGPADPCDRPDHTVFDDLPQVPFTSFTLKFQGGPKAVLANPPGCGEQRMTARLTPWSGGAADRSAASRPMPTAPAARAAPPRSARRWRSTGRPVGRQARGRGDAAALTARRGRGDGRVVTDSRRAWPGASPESASARGPGADVACPADSRVGRSRRPWAAAPRP